MDPNEIQARATIAAALIVSRAVELPTMPRSADGAKDTAGPRLRDLTDYIYQTITASRDVESLADHEDGGQTKSNI